MPSCSLPAWRHAVIGLAAISCLAGCNPKPATLTGLRCEDGQCVSGFTCDTLNDICVETTDGCEEVGRAILCADGETVRTCLTDGWTDCLVSCSASEAACNDGVDNDCDGDTDCTDLECNGSGCGANGLQCNGSLCECPGGASEGSCDDAADDDCDGDVDCADSDCAGQTCGGNGQLCGGGACQCPGGELTETTCDDSNDNDCDGFDDCADSDCGSAVCAPNGLLCAGTSCQCPGGGSESTCDDGGDEDCDGDTDCDDGDCDGLSCGSNGELCAGSACACPGGPTESVCTGGSDEDCDGSADCADNDCDGLSCAGDGEVCTGGACLCPGTSPETACTGGVDDDCDGDTDCDDADCATDVACQCSASGPIEIACSDGADDDCDGDTDCADTECLGMLCGSSDVCLSGACTAAPANCNALLIAEPLAATGLWIIDPDGAGGNAPFEAWCEMTVDSGGWTLVGRSHSSGGTSMGWEQAAGSPSVDTGPFSMDVAASGLTFTQVLFGDYSTGKTWGNNTYREDVPPDFLTAYRTSSIDMGTPAVVSGTCTPGGGSMFRWFGRTARSDNFFMRDNSGSDVYGLRAIGFQLNYNNCSQGGDLNGDQGMLFVR